MRLTPRTRILIIRLNLIFARYIEILPVEQIFLVAFVVDGMKFRWIQEAAGVQAVRGDEVAPFLAPVSQPEAPQYRTEAAVGGVNRTCRLSYAHSRSRGDLDH